MLGIAVDRAPEVRDRNMASVWQDELPLPYGAQAVLAAAEPALEANAPSKPHVLIALLPSASLMFLSTIRWKA
jgi:hypothetical protein